MIKKFFVRFAIGKNNNNNYSDIFIIKTIVRLHNYAIPAFSPHKTISQKRIIIIGHSTI